MISRKAFGIKVVCLEHCMIDIKVVVKTLQELIIQSNLISTENSEKSITVLAKNIINTLKKKFYLAFNLVKLKNILQNNYYIEEKDVEGRYEDECMID